MSEAPRNNAKDWVERIHELSRALAVVLPLTSTPSADAAPHPSQIELAQPSAPSEGEKSHEEQSSYIYSKEEKYKEVLSFLNIQFQKFLRKNQPNLKPDTELPFQISKVLFVMKDLSEHIYTITIIDTNGDPIVLSGELNLAEYWNLAGTEQEKQKTLAGIEAQLQASFEHIWKSNRLFGLDI